MSEVFWKEGEEMTLTRFHLMRGKPLDGAVDRSDWFRIPIREEQSESAELKVGNMVTWSRSIIRAGYWVQFTDVPIPELNEKTINRLGGEMDVSEEFVKSFLFLLEDGFPRVFQTNKPAIGFDNERIHYLLKRVYRRIQDEWVAEKRKEEKARDGTLDLDLRTFYYFNHKPVQGEILEIATRQIGDYSRGYQDYDGEWNPPYLSEKSRHQLYRCYVECGGNWYHWSSESRVLVHPLDAKPIEQYTIG